MKCEYCGTAAENGSTTCRSCGTPLPVAEVKTQIQPMTVQQPESVQVDDGIKPLDFKVYAKPHSRTVYVLLAIFLGMLGIHNFYAGYTARACLQLAMTLFLGFLGFPLMIVVIWVIIEILAVKKDAAGLDFL